MVVEVLEPHGFCAGVRHALELADRTLAACASAAGKIPPAPVYCLHAIVHNELVVGDLERRGMVFVERIDEVPEGATVLFSAHGVSPDVRARAHARHLQVIDATCPFVAKVHAAARTFSERGLAVAVIGNPEHAEVKGIVGEITATEHFVLLGQSAASRSLDGLGWGEKVPPPQLPLGVVSQTTMNADEVKEIVGLLKKHYRLETMAEVCNATKERQDAVRRFSGDGLLVLGSVNSSNTRRLCEVARCRVFRAGTLAEVKALSFAGVHRLGVTSGASTPESFFADAMRYLNMI